ncbi:MAG: Oxalate/formate antiporter, partial [uncultured Solirubrobacteraceae bacterium]
GLVDTRSRTYRRSGGLPALADPARRPGGPPVHRAGLRLLGLQGPAGRALRHQSHADRDHLQHRHRDARAVRRLRRHVDGAQRAAQGDGALGPVLGGRLLRRRARSGHGAALAGLPRLRRPRRHRPGHRLHLARLDPDQVVPGPSGTGHRPGHHGVRRRRADRRALLPVPARDLRRHRCAGDRAGVPDARIDLPGHHPARRLHRPRTARGLAAGGLDAPDQPVQQDDHVGQRDRRGVDQDAAVLAAVDGPVLQRHRRHRHPRTGIPDGSGLLRRRVPGGRRRLRRPAVPVQHDRPLRVVVDLGSHRPQADLHGVPGRRRGHVLPRRHGQHRVDRPLRTAHRRDHLLLRRRVRDGPGLPQGPVRNAPGRRHPRSPADRLGGGGRGRTAHRQRPRRLPERKRRRGLRSLLALAADHGRRAGGRLRRQPAHPPGRRAPSGRVGSAVDRRPPRQRPAHARRTQHRDEELL